MFAAVDWSRVHNGEHVFAFCMIMRMSLNHLTGLLLPIQGPTAHAFLYLFPFFQKKKVKPGDKRSLTFSPNQYSGAFHIVESRQPLLKDHQ